MSYNSLTSDDISAGKPTTESTQMKIKDNFDDHESRLETLQDAFITLPLLLSVNGRYAAVNNILQTTVNTDLTIVGVRILINTAGSAGETEIDLLRKRGAGAFESVLSFKPTVHWSAGDDALSSNAVLDLTKTDLLSGDILRLDITSAQTNGIGFVVRVDYTR